MNSRKQQSPLGKALFITGTDTGVGKTIIACALAAEFHRRGLRVGVMKPVETGVTPLVSAAENVTKACHPELVSGSHEMLKQFQHDKSAGVPRSSDAWKLKHFSGCRLPIEDICPYRFREPLGPWVAARLEGTRIDLDRLCRSALSISRSHDITVIEGAGGLLVPLTQHHTFRDLARSLHLPVLIVGRLGLGTINHTLLTIEAANHARLRIAGIVLNKLQARPDPSSRHNSRTLRALAQEPFLGVFPRVRGNRSPRRLAALARRSLDVNALLNTL